MNLDHAALQNSSAISFILHNKITNENDKPIEFTRHAFLARPYLDETPRMAIKKAAQVGFSTLAIIRAAHLAKFKEANVIYTLPSRNMVKDFVTPKVDPLFSNNPALYNMLKPATEEDKKKQRTVDSSSLKRIGNNFVYFRSSWDEASGIGISAHILINDEVDRSNQKPLRVYESRLDAAKMDRPDLAWVWKFSNPSMPGFGVSEEYDKSDQKEWLIKCPHCNYWQALRYPDNIDFKREVYICAKCERLLSDDDRCRGEWVAKYPDRKISGYWMSQMMVPWHSAGKIIEDSKKDPSVFHNFTLGLEYQEKDMSIGRQDILRCINLLPNPRTGVSMGVDVGKVKHFVLGNEFGVFRVGTTTSWEEIEDLRNQYNAVAVIDGMPNPDEPHKLARKYPGKVWVNYYAQDSKQLGAVRWGEGDKFGVVESDRTKTLDSIVADINSQDLQYNLTEFQLEEYITHWGNMYRVIVENDKGMMTAHWLHTEGRPDHFCHAHNYQKIAALRAINTGAVIRRPAASEGPSNPLIVNKQGGGYDISDAIKRMQNAQRMRKQ